MEGMRGSYGALLLITLLFASLGCDAQNSTVCQEASNCAECIAIDPSCSWCAQNDFPEVRCDTAARLSATNCTDIQDPEPYVFNVTKNESLSNAGDAALGQAIQVQPQEMHLRIRNGETAQIRMNVRPAEDYPVDMYYLMDLSESMREDLDTLRSLAGDIVDKMQELTRNFRVGFGSFVDKSVIPYANISADGSVILTQCLPGCVEPYLFKNDLSLTNSSELFQTSLNNAASSISADQPEAGFDALVQVAVCMDEIGWRESARHIVVFASDAPYHSAGDGRIGGILKPNDGLCHLDANGQYNADKPMDYPSLGQLSSLIQDQNINIMFLVTDSVEDVYRAVIPFIPGSQFGQLAPNSDNILFWIEKLYRDITSVVSLSVRAPEDLLLEFTSHCANGVTTPNSKSCDGLSIGDTVSFTIDVTAESCVEGGSTRFTVSPVGYNEELVVNLEVICECDCQNTGIPNSPECTGNGTQQCGQCTCNTGSYGEMCQCSGDTTLVGDDRAACIALNAASVCSGRGECFCGECICQKQADPTHIVSGKYCQCDNFNCPLFEGQLCGGPQRGHCECDVATQQSKCICTSEYTGDSCSCLRSQANCIAPNGLICNGHGTCECGACTCDVSGQFKGQTCFDCATCSGQCEVYQECVECKAFNSGPLIESDQCNMCAVEINVVTVFPEVDYPYNCTIRHDDNCSIVFIPHFVDGENSVPVIYVLEDTVCPLVPPAPRVNPLWIAVGLIIFIVILGLILIFIYKAYITWLYKKEFKEWEKEKNNPQFSQNENPLYKPASTIHQNPAYGTQFSDSGVEATELPEKL